MLEYTISSLQLNPPAQGFPVGKSRKIRIPSGIGLKTLADKIQVSELCQNVLGAEAELSFLPGAAMLSPCFGLDVEAPALPSSQKGSQHCSREKLIKKHPPSY